MSSWYTIRRQDVGTNVELNPGEYRVSSDRSGNLKVLWRCPNCSQLLTLLHQNHSVRYDGTIHPNVRCPHGSCGFEEWLQLEGWIPRAQGAA